MNEMLITLLQVRNQCLATVTKIIHFSELKALGEELGDLPISSFIAGLLTQKDMTTVAKALQLAEILMHKLPGIFSKYFLKEGVVHAVEQLAASAPLLAGEEKAKSKAAKRASQRLKVSRKAYPNTTSVLSEFGMLCSHHFVPGKLTVPCVHIKTHRPCMYSMSGKIMLC